MQKVIGLPVCFQSMQDCLRKNHVQSNDEVLTCHSCAGSSVPSAYSGSGFASIPGLGSRPSHSIDVSRSATGEAQRFVAQVPLQTAAASVALAWGL